MSYPYRYLSLFEKAYMLSYRFPPYFKFQPYVFWFSLFIILLILTSLFHTVEEQDRERRESEMRRMQEEVKDLRHQLHKSASVLGDMADLRKELDRSEKQRQQLSDHIEVRTKQTPQQTLSMSIPYPWP